MHDTKKPTPAPVPGPDLPDPARWPNARRALVLTKQEQMDRAMHGSNRDWAEWRDAQEAARTVAAALRGDPAALDEVARALVDEADADDTLPGLGGPLGGDS